MPRLFVSIDLPRIVKRELSGICSGLPNGRWVKEEQIHLTLRFIGEVDDKVFQEIKKNLAEIESLPFSIRLAGVGCFPSRAQPRIVWAGVDPGEPVSALRNKVEAAMVNLGLPPEGQKFSPHVTLARLRDTPPAAITRYLSTNTLFTGSRFEVKEFYLYSSVLTKNGAVYRVVADYPLVRPSV
jgi:2'-5' RNA ligase